MSSKLKISGVEITIERKPIKNTHLSVYPPAGRVLITAPLKASEESLRFLAIRELSWIRKQQAQFQKQPREPKREFIERESHMVWGRRYLLRVVDATRPHVGLSGKALKLEIGSAASQAERESLVKEWYRVQLRSRATPLVEKWSDRLGVTVDKFYIQQMRTKWGSSSPQRRAIRLNLELAKHPPECLDYVVLHEVAHFIVPNHGVKFVRILDRHMPQWRTVRARLSEIAPNYEPLAA